MKCAWLIGLAWSVSVILWTASSYAAESVDQSPLAVHYEQAFADLRPPRPVVIANAGDGSNRMFVVTQQGIIHVFPNRQDQAELQTFFDLHEKVVYADNQNEEGLLGLAFHPKYKETGEFFLYYTTTAKPRMSVVSRFRVSKDDPNRADPTSEEILMEIPEPYWNHNGGTLAFGPDGCLYIALGDGGAFNDPHMNGQNVQTWLGSILRIDVDHRSDGRNYAIPPTNPFAKEKVLAKPEIYAYGFRNVWRMSFDRETGTLWAADVGQDLWEEIDLVRRGGNYGWNLREGRHKFGPAGAEAREDLVEPIWEYNHEVGKSITGGNVYRGQLVPSLRGYYLYGDYVSGKMWALKYDAATKRVVENRPIAGENIPVITFGEDESGEVYFSDSFGRLFRFVEGK